MLGGTPSTKTPEYWNGDIIWITPAEVVANQGDYINDSARKITREGLANSSAKMLPVDTVLLTSRATIGAVALSGVPLATNQGFTSLICGSDLLPRFAMYWCQANTREFIIRSTGNTFREISRKNVAAIQMNLPPLEEQQRIIEIISGADQMLQATEKAIVHTRSLRDGVLINLLSGEHEIPDSYDALLEAV